MTKRLTITIPCYNQTELLKRLLDSLRTQTAKDFKIIIIDDQSQEDYPRLITAFADLDIVYERNQKNLGAIQNIFKSILYPVETPFVLSLHEDDVLTPSYLDEALEFLQNNAHAAFVAGTAIWFTDDEDLKRKKLSAGNVSERKILSDRRSLVFEFVRGIHVVFGSIVYRVAARTGTPDIERFAVLCDRPFLAEMLREPFQEAGLIQKGIYVRDHSVVEDHRGDSIRENHMINLYDYYRRILEPMSKHGKKIFLTHSTNNLAWGYSERITKEMTFGKFMRTAKEQDVFEVKYLRLRGIVGFILAFFKT